MKVYCVHMSRLTWRSGFTALEALIVLAFFGLLITLGALSISSARARMRDAVRLSDMNMVRAGLALRWQQSSTYPIHTGLDLGVANTSDGLTLNGFGSLAEAQPPLLLERVPAPPKNGEGYHYKGNTNGYAIRFETERDTFLGPPNVYYVHSTGFDVAEDLK